MDRFGNSVDPNALDPALPPTDITLSNASVRENVRGAFIGELSVEDPNNAAGDTHTFDLSDPRFEVRGGDQLHLVGGVSLDFEAEETVSLTIGATDLAGLRFEKTFPIQVLDEPSNIVLSNDSFREESAGQAVGFIGVTDFEPNPSFTFGDPRFEVVAGVLKLVGAASVDFETEPSINLEITAVNVDGNRLPRTLPLTVIDIDEAASGFPATPADLDGTNGFAFTNGLSGGYVGVSLSSSGDVNGDGFDDLLATSYFGDGLLNDFAYLIPGDGTSFPPKLTSGDLAARGGTTFTMPSQGLIRGLPTGAHLGDFNGDGVGDLILGASGVAGASGVFGDGQVYIVLGQASGLPVSVDLTDPATFDGVKAFKIEGANSSDRLGITLGPAGDIDGDGFDDALIGFGTGGALVLYGQEGPYPATQVSNNITDMRTTLFAQVHTGPVAGIGDFNGDGYDDLFVGIEEGFTGFSTSGAVVFGQPGGLEALLDPSLNLDFADIIIGGGANRSIAEEPGQVGPAGDINSDGFEDFFLVAGAAGAPVSIEGDLIVLYGGESFPDTIDLGDNDGSGPQGASPIAYLGGGTRGVQIVPGADFGRTVPADISFVEGVVGAGDVNGDGNDDLLLHVINSVASDNLHVVIFGHPFLPGTIVMDPASFTPQQGLGLGGFVVRPGFGFTPVGPLFPFNWVFNQGLGGMGDLNGDGFDDIVFGDPFGEPAVGFFGPAGLDYVLFGGDLSGLVSHLSSDGNDFLLGDEASDDILIGGLGNDTLVGRGGRDVYYGGHGDDLIVVTGVGIPEYVRIDGGGGRDTVRLQGNNLVWDLGTTGGSSINPAGNHLVESIEIIDLGLGGSVDSHTLILAVDDLADLPGVDRSLTIIGDASDTLTFRGSVSFDRSETRQGIEFDIYNVDKLTNFELVVAKDVRWR